MKHDRSCKLRAFPITCKACGAKLLYWECVHGCKVMFEFNSVGKLAGRHKCSGPPQEHRERKKKLFFDYDANFDLSSISKRFVENMFRDACKCPVCAKEFSSEHAYYQHLRQKKEVDDAHETFYNENKAVITTIDDGSKEGAHEAAPRAIQGNTPQQEPEEPAGEMDLPSKEDSTGDGASSSINDFGRIRLKTKDGKVKAIHNATDWWDEFKEK